MKAIKTVMAGAIAMALVSFGANAEESASTNAVNQGQGVVNFKGIVVDAPCGIAPESADQSIDFGQISKAHLNAGGISVKKDLNIKLVNCEPSKSVKVSFSGAAAMPGTDVTALGTAGGTGTAIVISSQDGLPVTFDGTYSHSAQKLSAGNNILHYQSWVKALSDGSAKEGDFSAVANFNLTYE